MSGLGVSFPCRFIYLFVVCVLSHHVCPRVPTQVVRHGGKHLHKPSRLSFFKSHSTVICYAMLEAGHRAGPAVSSAPPCKLSAQQVWKASPSDLSCRAAKLAAERTRVSRIQQEAQSWNSECRPALEFPLRGAPCGSLCTVAWPQMPHLPPLLPRERGQRAGGPEDISLLWLLGARVLGSWGLPLALIPSCTQTEPAGLYMRNKMMRCA